MLFTAYFDEADTHGPSPTVIMAGFLGTARQWEIFERRLRGLQRRDAFSIFHVNEFKSKSSEFAGWSDPKCMKLVGDLAELVRDNLTEGFTVHLERDRYLNEYRAPPIPKKMTLDSQYGVVQNRRFLGSTDVRNPRLCGARISVGRLSCVRGWPAPRITLAGVEARRGPTASASADGVRRSTILAGCVRFAPRAGCA